MTYYVPNNKKKLPSMSNIGMPFINKNWLVKIGVNAGFSAMLLNTLSTAKLKFAIFG